MMSGPASVLLRAFFLLVVGAGAVQGQSRPTRGAPPLVAEVVPGSVSATAEGVAFSIAVEVPRNHHGYIDRGDDGFLIPFAFSFPTLEGVGTGIEVLSAPPGVRDEKFRAQVLRGRAEYRFRLGGASAIPEGASASLRYQICNDRTEQCFPPKVVKVGLGPDS